MEKVREEIAELEQAHAGQSRDEIEGELGDLLFTIVNVARFLDVDPEQALRRMNLKFRDRFGYVERALVEKGSTLEQSKAEHGIEEMEALWQRAKKEVRQS
jgi:uncharacterized protein YabN with tetrapyrrole methylase and pyrophosphatase domain